MRMTRRTVMKSALTVGLLTTLSVSTLGTAALAQDKITLRMSTPATETDFRSQGLATLFADGVSEFADYEPHYYYNNSLFKQDTELGNLAISDCPAVGTDDHYTDSRPGSVVTPPAGLRRMEKSMLTNMEWRV